MYLKQETVNRPQYPIMSSKSAEIVCSIDDLLTQILLCVPIRSLIRFKSVSKHWFSLITNPNFCHLRSSQKKNPPNGLFFNIYGRHRYYYLPSSPQQPRNPPSVNRDFTNNPSLGKILQSCNGLFLCGNEHSRRFYVYNPTTKRSTLIPEFRKRLPFVKMLGLAFGKTLAFDPVKSPYYKVVFVRFIRGPASQIEIYSSETGGWRIGGELDRRRLNFGNGVYWNGSIHWLSSDLVGNSLRFHVEAQVLDEMPTPPVQRTACWSGNCYFGESCDRLHFIEHGPKFNVYEMKRDYSEWFVRYFVDLSPVNAAYPEVFKNGLFYDLYKFSLFCGEKEEDLILVLLVPGRAIKYNIVDGNFEKLSEFEGDSSAIRYAKGFQYFESLSSV